MRLEVGSTLDGNRQIVESERGELANADNLN
jgi:hypothetical protein